MLNESEICEALGTPDAHWALARMDNGAVVRLAFFNGEPAMDYVYKAQGDFILVVIPALQLSTFGWRQWGCREDWVHLFKRSTFEVENAAI